MDPILDKAQSTLKYLILIYSADTTNCKLRTEIKDKFLTTRNQ